MKVNYTDDQLEFAEQMRQVQQGVIVYIQPGATTGPAFNPVVGEPIPHTLDAIATGVSSQYVDGTLIVATDKEITSAVFGVVPDSSGEVVIDGKALQIVKLWQVPAAGTPVAWKFIARA